MLRPLSILELLDLALLFFNLNQIFLLLRPHFFKPFFKLFYFALVQTKLSPHVFVLQSASIQLLLKFFCEISDRINLLLESFIIVSGLLHLILIRLLLMLKVTAHLIIFRRD